MADGILSPCNVTRGSEEPMYNFLYVVNIDHSSKLLRF